MNKIQTYSGNSITTK